jgi:hypothetical protein
MELQKAEGIAFAELSIDSAAMRAGRHGGDDQKGAADQWGIERGDEHAISSGDNDRPWKDF